ncbi:MAG: multidrug effflux MFS transporter [Pseudomonadota bacterium]|nr:multidrug effflux MFS transporter [Pseudomonadota bacterium]
MSRGRYLFLAGLLGLLPMLLPLSVDGSLALVPDIAAYFATDIGSVQLTLTAVVLGIAVGQLFYGPVSDRFGRKPVIIFGVACYALAGIGCANAPSIEWLIFFRFLQGFFACSGIIVARAVIRDMFDREAGARLFALMMGIHGIMPTLAPGVSGWMTQTFGWQSVFWVMVGFGVFTGISVWLGLPETSKSRIVSATRPAELLANYRTIFRNRAFLSYATCACFMYGALMAYFAGAPVGFIKYLGLVPIEFGIAMAVPMVTYVVTQIAVARLAPRIGLDLMIRIGVFFAAIAGIGMLAFVQLDMINIYTLIGPVVLVLGSLAFITPSTTAGALSPFAEMAGAASSLLGFIQFLAAAAATALVGLLNDGTPGPMAAVICVCCLGSLIAYLVLVLPLRRVDQADH